MNVPPLSAPPTLEDYPSIADSSVQRGGRRVSKPSAAVGGHVPKVSIVTIVRNGVRTLPRTLKSVFEQDVSDIEYVIIDGGSTDGTLELLRAHEPRIDLWISAPDRGISDAFNKGISLCRGEVIGLLNSDDWYEPGAIRAALQHLQQSGAEVACGGLQHWEGDRRTYLASSDPAHLRRGMTVAHPTMFVRRALYRKIGLYRLDFLLAMDYEWALRAVTAGARYVALNQCLANMQGGGVGDRRWRDSQREVARARALHIPGANTAGAYHTFVVRRIAMGYVRRLLDTTGLSVVRRAYHRWVAPNTIISSRDDGSH